VFMVCGEAASMKADMLELLNENRPNEEGR
jgi:hypothetical protein